MKMWLTYGENGYETCLPLLDFECCQVKPLWVEAHVQPAGVEGAERVDAKLNLAHEKLQTWPETLQRIEERPSDLRSEDVRINVPSSMLQVFERRIINVMEDGEILDISEEHVGFEHVLVERVDPTPAPSVRLRPLPGAQVNMRTQ